MSHGVAVIGAGVVGRMRMETVRAHPALTLRAIADVDPVTLAAAVTDGDVVRCADARAVLDVGGVDLVIVSSPAHLHEQMVVDALRAGRHVLCEKPLATNVESCRRMVQAGEESGKTLAVGFNHRYFPSITQLRRVLDAGMIGAIDHARVFGGHQGLSQFRAPWMYQGALSGGGAMMDIGIHLTDLTRFLVGDVVEVRGVASHAVWNVEGSEDNALAIFRTAAGVPVTYQATWSEWRGFRSWIDVYGTRGMARASYGPMFNLVVSRDEKSGRTHRDLNLHAWVNIREKLFGWETTARRAFADELDDLLKQLDGQPSSNASGLDGLRAVEVAHAVYASSRDDRVVLIPSS